MKKLFCIVLAAAVAVCVCAQDRSGLVRHTIKDQGIEREYYLFVPDNLIPEAPLVFDLHGYSGSASKHWSGLLDVAKKEGFALCVPQGAVDPNGKNAWEVGYPFQKGAKIDDVKFLKRLARHIQKECKLSRVNTFVTGMSNGGEMCYILAFRASDTFRAFAPISGLMMDWAYRELKAPRPVPLMEVHGSIDQISKWNGDPYSDDIWGKYISVPSAVGFWVARDRCNHEITEHPSLVSEKSHEVILHRYVNGTDGCEVRLYEIVGGDHGFHPGEFREAQAIWDFFESYLTHPAE